MKKALLILISLLFFLVALTACTGRTIPVEDVEVARATLDLAVSGEFSSRVIEARALPENATNKRLRFRFVEAGAAEFFNIDANTGRLTSKGFVTPEGTAFTVRVESVEKTSIFRTVRVRVRSGEIEEIRFNTARETVRIGSEPLKITPVIIPDFAIGNVRFSILNPELASVTQEGHTGSVTALKKGYTSLLVRAQDVDNVETALPLDILFQPLDYNISLQSERAGVPATSLSPYKQIMGEFENFRITVSTSNAYSDTEPFNLKGSDPHPDITWQMNGSVFGGNDFNNQKSIVVNPNDPILKLASQNNTSGYTISAVLKSGSDVQTLTLNPIFVYNPLVTLDVRKTTSQNSFQVGELVEFRAQAPSDQYPPDGYAWFLYNRETGERKAIGHPTPPVVIGNAPMGQLLFAFPTQGNFDIICVPMIKGIELKNQDGHTFERTVANMSVDYSDEGQEIFNVFFDGAILSGKPVPFVRWDALAYDSHFEVRIQNTTREGSALQTLSSRTHPNLFTKTGVYIPEEIATLCEGFTITIRGERYIQTSPFVYSEGQIPENVYMNGSNVNPYYLQAENFGFGFNRYIANVKELGNFLNYILKFRPEEYKNGKTLTDGIQAGRVGYERELYIPFVYDDIRNLYTNSGRIVPTGLSGKSSTEELLSLAFDVYGDTSAFSRLVTENTSVTFKVEIYVLPELSPKDTPGGATKTHKTSHEDPHYGAGIDKEIKLPYESNSETISVKTSNELFFAISLGKRPVPVSGSEASVALAWAEETVRAIADITMNDAEKVHAVYDYLTKTVSYDYRGADWSSEPNAIGAGDCLSFYKAFNIEGVMDGSAVCDGIAKAFNLMCWMLGVTSTKISGRTLQSPTSGAYGGHTWNRTLINGEWYISDATWGNMAGGHYGGEIQTHRYLLRSYSDMNVIRGAYYERITYGTAFESMAENNYDLNQDIEEEKKIWVLATVEDAQKQDGYAQKIADALTKGNPTENRVICFEFILAGDYEGEPQLGASAVFEKINDYMPTQWRNLQGQAFPKWEAYTTPVDGHLMMTFRLNVSI
ncbi:MAG: hypothetical protein FWD49_01005 [Firmicutes bacterium]|nr:hypothetical protein [Bacillota bacterium]